MSLLHTSLQHISRSSKKNKNYCSIIKAVCKQQLQEEKKYQIQFWSIPGFESRLYNCCDTAAEIYWFDIIYCMKKIVHQNSDWR